MTNFRRGGSGHDLYIVWEINSDIDDYIYNFIVKLSDEDAAPKITGMIIDLDEKDLIESVRTY